MSGPEPPVLSLARFLSAAIALFWIHIMRALILGLALATHPVHAVFDNFFFAGNGGKETKPQICGSSNPYACNAPNMCAQDSLTKLHHCCEPGLDGECWIGR